VLQERLPGFVELNGLAAEWQFDAFGCRETTGAMEHAHPRVDLHRGAQQKILNRGVEILAHHQARL
jgi:hypothetical protein